jgi:hypothetical protein
VWRTEVSRLHQFPIIPAVPVFAVALLLIGTRRVLGRYLAFDDLPTREQEMAQSAFGDIDKVIVRDRDTLLIEALTSIHKERCAEAIKIACTAPGTCLPSPQRSSPASATMPGQPNG